VLAGLSSTITASDSTLFHEAHDFFLLALAVIVAGLTAWLAVKLLRRGVARAGESYFRLLAESIPEIVWTATPGQGIDYCNQRWYEITGLTPQQSAGFGWTAALHPDDRPVAAANWEKGRQAGDYVDAQYRLRTASGGFRWYLVRANPIRDAEGRIIKWFGACTDIDDQVHTQQLLEEQVKQHIRALEEANLQLRSEMEERQLAQQELDVQSERMLRELTQRTQRATAMAKMAELLQSCATRQDVFAVVAGTAPKVFPDLRGAVLLLNSSHQMLEVAAQWTDCKLSAMSFGPQDCWALRTNHAHSAPPYDSTALCGHVETGGFAYVCLPLFSQGKVIGVLHYQTTQPREMQESEVSIATTFAEQIGLSIANIDLRDALRNQSIRDPLTGLYNRRYLEETLERETRRAVRAEHGLGVLMLDLDHFKKFNDTYGHDAGDTVLRETATFLAKSVRAEDIVCRFGGEEFIIILPMADLSASQARAERIRSKLSELSILYQGRPIGKVTVSVGVAGLPQHGTSPRQLLELADAALYRAKGEGRDRAVVAEIPALIETEELFPAPRKQSAQPCAGR